MATQTQFSVSPCLFIGIGTNGWRILNELRQFIYEEFGRAGLPCFRYIGIESNSDKKPDDSFLPQRPESYERISPVYISIGDVNVMRRRLNAKLTEDYMPGLGDWLDVSLIERGTKSYTAGAGNARQAGRMCLWENWKPFTLAVSAALDAIKNPDNRVATDKFLKEEYFAKKRKGVQPPRNSLINAAPKVYIFGTLCGGTCSGSFIDIAYYVSKQLGLLSDVQRGIIHGPNDPEVVGLFTITDLRLVADVENRRGVANCWAAMRELDFHYQKEGRFFAKFPDGTEIDTLTEPFDTIYLESLHNMGDVGFDRSDYDGLAQMCAMNLFTEVVAGLAGTKNESRVNLRQTAPGYLQPNQMGHIRAFSSFGLSAFWYPKYRIAQAMNRHLAIEMCAGWLGAPVQANPIRDQAEQGWKELMGEIRGSLVGTVPKAQCNVNLPTRIDEAFAQREADFMETGGAELGAYLVNFPTAESTFAQKLSSPAGDYFSRMANAEPLVANDLKSALLSRIESYFRDHTCTETREYVAALIERMSKDAELLPDELSTFSQNMDVSLASEIQNAWWAASFGLRNEAVVEYKRHLWAGLRQRVQDHVDHLRNYFVKKVLVRARSDMANLQTQVSQAEARLRMLRDGCEQEKRKLIAFQPPGHIVTIAAGEQNTIAEDVDLGARRILKETDANALRKIFVGDSDPMKLLTSDTQEQLRSRIDLSFGQFSQNITSGFQIPEKVLTTSRSRIPDLLVRAAPYVDATGGFRGLPSKDTPNFVFCSDSKSTDEIVDIVNETLKEYQYKPAFSPLDHFVIFYHEAVGLALSNLAISERASAILTELEKDPNRIATNFTHKQGEKMFDVDAIRDVRLLLKWIKCMQYLDADAFQSIGKDVVLSYETPEGLTKHLAIDNSQALRDYAERYGSEGAIKTFTDRLVKMGKPALLSKMADYGKKAQSVVDKERIDEDHEFILKQAFTATGRDSRPANQSVRADL